MYDSDVDADNYNISLDGHQMIMEDLTPNESFNRRETIRHNIIGGTQTVMRGNYLPRDFTFTTHLLIDPDFPDVYDSIIKEWQSKPVEVISKYMGGKFNAEVIIKKSPSPSSNYLAIEVQVIEIPGDTSLIPNDEFIIPADKVSQVSKTSKKGNNKNKNNKNSKTTTKNKNNKNNKKNKNNKNKKNKGNNITKTNKKNK